MLERWLSDRQYVHMVSLNRVAIITSANDDLGHDLRSERCKKRCRKLIEHVRALDVDNSVVAMTIARPPSAFLFFFSSRRENDVLHRARLTAVGIQVLFAGNALVVKVGLIRSFL